MSSGSWPDLSNVHVDILSEIIKRLDIVTFIRSGAVCTTWRNLTQKINYHNNKVEIPWLMLSSREKVEYRCFYSITEKKKKYVIHLPELGDKYCFQSSQGFLISIDDNADLYTTNPITGTHIPLPPTSTSPHLAGTVTDPDTGKITHYIQNSDFVSSTITYSKLVPFPVFYTRNFYYKKIILSPSKDIAVAICGTRNRLAFARLGDDKWTAMPGQSFRDATFHKGKLHVIDCDGAITVFGDLDESGALSVSPWCPPCRIWETRRYLVESPDGEDLFLVYKKAEDMEDGRPVMTSMRVFLLDKATYTWNRIKNLGEVAFFVGFNHSMSLSTRDYPGLKRNSVYFTDDEDAYDMGVFDGSMDMYPADDMGVLNLEDGSIEGINVDNDSDVFHWLSPMWFMPTI